MGVTIIHFPGYCTGLCQPLDIGLNQSFKAFCHRMWKEWMTNLIDEINKVHNAMHKEVSEWAAGVFWETIGSQILKKSWRRLGHDWLPGVVDPNDIVQGDNGDDEDDDGKDDDGDNDDGDNDRDNDNHHWDNSDDDSKGERDNDNEDSNGDSDNDGREEKR